MLKDILLKVDKFFMVSFLEVWVFLLDIEVMKLV